MTNLIDGNVRASAVLQPYDAFEISKKRPRISTFLLNEKLSALTAARQTTSVFGHVIQDSEFDWSEAKRILEMAIAYRRMGGGFPVQYLCVTY